MEPPPSPPPFRVGDRVRLISPLGNLAVGTIGTVRTRFLGSSLYDVQFDNPAGLQRVVDGRRLELIPPEPSRRW